LFVFFLFFCLLVSFLLPYFFCRICLIRS
jgi:hypothetical protein